MTKSAHHCDLPVTIDGLLAIVPVVRVALGRDDVPSLAALVDGLSERFNNAVREDLQRLQDRTEFHLADPTLSEEFVEFDLQLDDGSKLVLEFPIGGPVVRDTSNFHAVLGARFARKSPEDAVGHDSSPRSSCGDLSVGEPTGRGGEPAPVGPVAVR